MAHHIDGFDSEQLVEVAQRESPCGPATAALIERHMPLVKATARRLSIRDINDWQDALQGGQLGLLEALRRFDSARGVGFAAYARRWVKGGILDAVYRGCPPRTSISREERASRERDATSTAPTVVAYEALDTEIPASTASPLDDLIAQEQWTSTMAAINKLPSRARLLLFQVSEGAPQAQIARERRVSRAAVSQELARARQQLRNNTTVVAA